VAAPSAAVAVCTHGRGLVCDSPSMPNPAAEERHATWLELFFDLVIVAAVAQLAHLLRDGPGVKQVFLFAVLYYAMWSVWTSLTLYANVSGALTRLRPMLTAMFGIAIMAASVPKVVRGEPAIFILAYVGCRLLAAGSWKKTSQIMTEWPGVQQAVGVIPWIASLGFQPPVRYYLWVAGIILDVVLSVVRSRDPKKLLADEQQDRDREQQKRLRRLLRRGEPVTEAPEHIVLQAAAPDRPHLGERLGLFALIVLGEAVAQLVNAAAEVENWDRPLWLVLLSGFGLLVAIWWLTLRYGSSAAPTYGMQVFALRLTMPAHYLTTGAIVAIAAGLGGLAGEKEVSEAGRWVLCAGAALYFLAATTTGVRGGAPRNWIWFWGVPSVIVPVVLGLFGGPLPAWALTAVLLVVALWHVLYQQVEPRPADGAPA
jgi:low temperature requirement protein LtrA